MNKKFLIVSWILTVIIAFAIGFFIAYPTVQMRNLGEEYGTAGVIRSVDKFVVEHKRWPENWAELEQDDSQHTTVNWEIDIFTADRHDIMQSIQPRTGFYITYPHAESHLQSLYDRIVEIRSEER